PTARPGGMPCSELTSPYLRPPFLASAEYTRGIDPHTLSVPSVSDYHIVLPVVNAVLTQGELHRMGEMRGGFVSALYLKSHPVFGNSSPNWLNLNLCVVVPFPNFLPRRTHRPICNTADCASFVNHHDSEPNGRALRDGP